MVYLIYNNDILKMVVKNDKGVFMALKFEGNYLNRYEQAHDLYQDNPFFNQEDWDTMSRRGDRHRSCLQAPGADL